MRTDLVASISSPTPTPQAKNRPPTLITAQPCSQPTASAYPSEVHSNDSTLPVRNLPCVSGTWSFCWRGTGLLMGTLQRWIVPLRMELRCMMTWKKGGSHPTVPVAMTENLAFMATFVACSAASVAECIRVPVHLRIRFPTEELIEGRSGLFSFVVESFTPTISHDCAFVRTRHTILPSRTELSGSDGFRTSESLYSSTK